MSKSDTGKAKKRGLAVQNKFCASEKLHALMYSMCSDCMTKPDDKARANCHSALAVILAQKHVLSE